MEAASCCTRPGAEPAPLVLGDAIDGADADEPPDAAEGVGVAAGDDAAAPGPLKLGLRAAAGVRGLGAGDPMTGADPCDPEMSNAATSATATVAAAPIAERR